MKGSRNNYVLVLAVILAVSFMVPAIAAARQDAFAALTPATGVPKDYALQVPFDEKIAAASVNRSNIYVTDSGNQKVGISRSLGSDGRTVIITPVKPYLPGETYTLYIRKTLKYASGKFLSEGLKKQFTVAPAIEALPVVGTRENLIGILEEAQVRNAGIYGISEGDFAVAATEALDGASANAGKNAAAATAPSDQKSRENGAPDYSATNVQVQGVDEADIVKTDGKYIYQVGGDRITISSVYPADRMKVEKVISLTEEQIYPNELYLDDRYLAVIGASRYEIPVYRSQAPEGKIILPVRPATETVKMLIYDIGSKADVKKVREIELKGRYLSSRKIGSRLYLVSNKYVDYYHIMQGEGTDDLPAYRDTASGEDFKNVGYDRIAYFPESIEPNYMIVAGVDLDAPKEGVHVSTYLGSGESIYASLDNLYVAVTRQTPAEGDSPVIRDSAAPSAPKRILPREYDRNTVVYRFAMNAGKLEYTGKGQVPGSILNQFSMDESDGFFRIATTKGDVWRTDENTSKNNLYVLDGSLNIAGRLEDIAPGERIYSVRFMGDRAYMVTFKKVDPLFVLDLKDAKNPRILGALKIPGYSDYLHPYDENHIIGFGKDAVEVVYKDEKGNATHSNAYYLGMKMAVFDVSDVAHPREMFSEKIGDRGTDSELLQNHKALLFSKEKNLLAFPVTLMEVKGRDKFESNGMPVHGSFSFQGAYVYGIDLEQGFQLKSRITHISGEDYQKSGDYWYDSNKNVQRILYIGDDLYTVSNSYIKAHGIRDMAEKGSLELQ